MIRNIFDGKQLAVDFGKWWSILSALSLILVAAIGGVYDVFHRSLAEAFPQLPDPELVLVGLLAFLCFGLGSERFLTLRKIEQSFEQASKERQGLIAQLKFVSTHLGMVESLIGPGAIEKAALELIESCSDNDKIKATGQFAQSDELSANYFKVLADRVKRARDSGGSMEYHVVVQAPSSSSTPSDGRLKAFEKLGVDNLMIVVHCEHPWPFEVLIGGHSMIVALRGGKRATYEVAVKIANLDFVEKATEWFHESVWRVHQEQSRPALG